MTGPPGAVVLRVVGPAPAPEPAPARGSYARTAYGTTPPEDDAAVWLELHEDGSATARSGKVEYGQGLRTGLAVEVADELRLPLSDVRVVLGDTDHVPWDMGTFGSQSTARVGLRLRKAAATARNTLLELASAPLDLPVDALRCADGAVESISDPSRRVAYAELLRGRDLTVELDEDAPLTPASEFTVMGRDTPRTDAVARVTGQAQYTRDIQLPGMLFAAVLRPPAYGAKLTAVDAALAGRAPGVVQVVEEDGLVAVLADTDEAAAAALVFVTAEWDEKPDQPSQWDLPQLLLDGANETIVTQEAGSLDDGFRAAEATLEATYFVPYVSNAPMEPRAAVAQWEGDRLTVWAGTQRPFGIRSELAERFGIDQAKVRVIAPEIGGGFGSKSIYRPAAEAARLAKAAGRPVRVAYSRIEEMTWATFRPAAIIEVRSGFTHDGRLVAWDFKAHHSSRDRPFIGQRGSETPYDVPNVRVSVAASASPLRPGSYRSLGGAVNHFAREVHMDEIAAAVGLDPVELRLRNLSHPRFRRVLESAAAGFGWDDGAPAEGTGRGVALGLDVGSYAATCVALRVQGREVVVERVSAALDCGLTVNPEGARNQMEGSIVMGLGTALHEGIEFENGRLLTTGFARYRVPRMTDAPRIEVALVGDAETPSTGAGEPGIVPIAAAIANAVFDQTGVRHRELPIGRHLGG